MPTTRGMLTIGICLFVIPLLADLFFLTAANGGKAQVTVSSALFTGYIYFAPIYFIYLFIYFIVLKVLFNLFKYTEY